MPDDLPGFSGERGAGAPLTRHQFEKRERERQALDVYTKTFSFPKVREALDLRDNDVAEKLVRAGWERYQAEEDHWGAEVFRKVMREDLREMRALLMELARDTDASNQLPAIDRLLKVHERMSKLDDLDKRKDDATGGPQVVVIDARMPWERQADVESTAEPVDELEAGDAE